MRIKHFPLNAGSNIPVLRNSKGFKFGLIAACLMSFNSTAVEAQAATAIVELTNFKFTPANLELVANRPVVLELRNDSSGGHSFSAPEFFATARIGPNSAALVRSGVIEVPAHSTVSIRLVPAAGRYSLKCSHMLHALFGMKGLILVR